MKFDISVFFENLFKKLKFRYNLKSIKVLYVNTEICTFMILFRPVLRTIRNVSYKSCTENQNTHFVLSDLPPPSKIMPFMR
jgi:hypothetical protein